MDSDGAKTRSEFDAVWEEVNDDLTQSLLVTEQLAEVKFVERITKNGTF